MNKENKNTNNQTDGFIFNKQNYILMAVSVAVIILGFILMSGTDDIYSTLKITIAPIVVLAGFGIGIYAIMKKPKELN